MFKSYNRAFATDEFEFINNIRNQPLWGNKYITALVAGQRSVLFFRSWIRSGIRKVGDLVFTNGIFNENHIKRLCTNKICMLRS